ncbi:MAG: hypothetical protein H8E78_00420, partial [Proteobacteria bacterium]|nr:hypothetical protein [Pseudomonadota bacterium]
MRVRETVILRVVGKALIPFILLFALYVQFHGDYGPGGGFQAGVIFAAGLILYALCVGLRPRPFGRSPVGRGGGRWPCWLGYVRCWRRCRVVGWRGSALPAPYPRPTLAVNPLPRPPPR